MRDVIAIMIWDKGEEAYTRPMVLNDVSKELKFKGRKPNKMILPESLTDAKLLKKAKNIGSYDCKIIKAIGK